MFSIWLCRAEMDGDMILQVSSTVCAGHEGPLGLYAGTLLQWDPYYMTRIKRTKFNSP